MASELSLSIVFGASAGAAFSVFGNLKGVMQRVSDVTRKLKAEQSVLGKTISAAARLPITDLHELNARYAEQQQHLARLRASTVALGRSQSAIAANEANRAQLRGKIMETAGLAYLAAKPIMIGVEFEASMSKVQALTRLNKDSGEMKALTAQARQLGAATSFTASEAAQAQGFLAMAGFKTQQILQSMPAMLDLAKAGAIDLQRTADIASNIQTAYGIDSSEMTRVADVLTAAFTNSNVDLEMLSQTMKYIGPVAREFGMSLEESAAMAGLLGNAGIQADMAGTALRGMMSKISGAKAKELQALGIATADAAGNMRALPEIIKDLNTVTGKMGKQEKISTIFSIFDQRAAPAVLALMGQTEKIDAAIDTVKNSAGAAAKTHQIMADNTAGALKTMQSAWEDLAISLTNTENGALRGAFGKPPVPRDIEQIAVSFARKLLPIQFVTRFPAKLVGKCPQCPTIAFPERMQGIKIAVQRADSFHERAPVQHLQPFRVCFFQCRLQPFDGLLAHPGIGGKGKIGLLPVLPLDACQYPLFAPSRRFLTKFPRLDIVIPQADLRQILENVAVRLLEMRNVKVPGNRAL
jgi:TP901 family phage tail tape measure protein